MDHETAQAFAEQWVSDWNAHDLEALLAHFSADVVFTSPFATRFLPDSGGVVRGKEALRGYWTIGLQRLPDLHFTIEGVYVGVDHVVINYRNQAAALVNEVLRFDGSLVVEGHGTYL